MKTAFTPTTDPQAQLKSLPGDLARQTFVLRPGAGIPLGIDPRCTLRHEGTLIFAFRPTFDPWTVANSAATACLLQCGSEDTPGAVFRVGVTRELDALVLSSSATNTPVRIAGDFSTGAQIVLCFGPYSATVLAKGAGTPRLKRGGRRGDRAHAGIRR
jgi:hypothetical protein